MVKIRLGGWIFRIKNKWEDVSFEEALQLYHAKDVRERVSILMTPALPKTLKVSDSHLLALYEIASFITEIPEVVGDKVEVPNAREWAFKDFELCRQAIIKHPENLALTFARINQILGLEQQHYIEIGAKALDGINAVTEQWKEWGIFDSVEPTGDEVAAGIERLQAFGVYGIVNRLAEHFGVLPEVIEKRSVNSVFLDWTYLLEQGKYRERLEEVRK